MEEKEYRIKLTDKDKNKLEQVLKLVDIDVDMVEVENTKEQKDYPHYGDKYYFSGSYGLIYTGHFGETYSESRLSIGNYFKSEEEAEFEVERLKVLAEMKKFAESEDRKWDGFNEHWYPYYEFEDGFIMYNYKLTSKSNDIYFESAEKAQECVKTIGEDRIRKFYIGVKE